MKDVRQVIENWRKSNNKGEAEMATILGLGKLQQNYNDFKNGRKKTFPFEVAMAFKEASGINLLDLTTDSREVKNKKEERSELQIIDSLSKSTDGLEEDHHRLVRSHEMLIETKNSLVKRLLSLNASVGVSSPSPETKPLLPDLTDEMQDKSDTDSETKKDKQKGKGKNSGKPDS